MMATRALAVRLRLHAMIGVRPPSSLAPLRAGPKPTGAGRLTLAPPMFAAFRLVKLSAIREYTTDRKQRSNSKDPLQQQSEELKAEIKKLNAEIKELNAQVEANKKLILDEKTSDSMRTFLKSDTLSLNERLNTITEARKSLIEKMAPGASDASIHAFNQSILGSFLRSDYRGPIRAFSDVLQPNNSGTKWLQSLPNAKVSKVPGSSGMTAVVMDKPATAFGATVAGDVLFVRDFYGRLLQEMWRLGRTVLIGNPGLGKSVLQTLIIMCLVAPDKLGIALDLIPKLVVRETVGRLFEFFILEQGTLQVYEVGWKHVDRTILIERALDPAKCLYLYDPASAAEPEPVLTQGADAVKTIATVSPFSSRVKEFLKKGGVPLYMPVWTEDEIMDARQFMCDRDPGLDQVFSETDTRSRFERFGGIFRHVFPERPEMLEVYEATQSARIAFANLNLVIAANTTIDKSDMDGRNVSGFLLQYDVDKQGPKPFRTFTMKYASDYVRRQVVERFNKLSLIETLGYIETARKGGPTDRLAPALERATHELVQRGATWEEVEWTPGEDSGVQKNEGVPLPKAMKVEIADLNDVRLKAGTLSVFAQSQAPFIESAYLENTATFKGTVGIQVKSGLVCKPMSRTAALAMIRKLKLGPSDRLAVWYTVLPEAVENWKGLKWEPLQRPVLSRNATKATKRKHAVKTLAYEALTERSDVTVQALVDEIAPKTELPREEVEEICEEWWMLAHIHEFVTVGIATHPYTVESVHDIH